MHKNIYIYKPDHFSSFVLGQEEKGLVKAV